MAAHRWSRRDTATISPFWEEVAVADALVTSGEDSSSFTSAFQLYLELWKSWTIWVNAGSVASQGDELA